MEQQNKWDNTLFDSKVWIEALDTSPTKRMVMYFVSILMYIISFTYLFKHQTSEYIAYVFVFIVNACFPFVWLSDYNNFVTKYFAGNPFQTYRTYGMYIAFALQFLALFLVLLKNENVRKMKMSNTNNDEYQTSRTESPNLDTKNKKTEQNDYFIASAFVTITTLIWCLIGHTFANTSFFPVNVKDQDLSSFVRTIRWLLDQPYVIIKNLEDIWRTFTNKFQTTPLIKAFGMYCVVFLSVFFGAFIRIPKLKHPLAHAPIDRFRVINMTTPFNKIFDRNLQDYRDMATFFLTIFVLFFVGILIAMLSYFVPSTPRKVPMFMMLIAIIIFFATFFAKREEIFPDSLSVKKWIFFLLSVVFGLIGTPVILAIMQLFTEAGLFTIFTNMYSSLTSFWSGTRTYSDVRTLNTGGLLQYLAFAVFIILTFVVYGLGTTENWLDKHRGKSFLMFLSVLVCMAISLFMALSTHFSMTMGLYNVLKTLIENVLVYLAPLTIVVLSIIQLVFAFQNHRKYKKFEKMKT